MWVLILITLSEGIASAEAHSYYRNMSDCFEGREQLLVDGEHYDGYFPSGHQAICLEVE